MKKLGYILFLAAFSVMALIPFVGLLIHGPAEAAANEILAQPPSWTDADGNFNKAVLNDASDYLADRFYLRQELITVDARLEAGLLGASAAEDVVLGKDGWLFYASTLNDYRGQSLMTDRELWSAARCLALVQEYARAKGVQTLFVIVPNKNQVYPEYMPAWAVPAEGEGNRERLRTYLEAEGVSCLDLTPVMQEKKGEVQLYQRLDSHWNNLGAALAHDAIVNCLGKQGTAYAPENFIARYDHAADLYAMIYPAGQELELQYYPDRAWTFTYPRPIRSAEDHLFRTESQTGEGKLLMFRDSFGNTLHTFMAESYAEAVFSRAMPYNLQLMATEQPDSMVIELVQRNLPWLAQRAPILPAPVRDADLTDAVQADPVPVTQADAQNGMYSFTGAVLEADVDSPIYLLCDGTLYEASPAGKEKGGFTAYLPGPATQVQVFYLQNGKLVASPGGN